MYYVYMLTNSTNSTLYVGVTNNIERRIYEHKEWLIDGFTKKYNLNKLVYFEEYLDIKDAIHREKQLKKWKREWKEALIEKNNSFWKDILLK